ncbi:hypothetical protein HQ447_18905 [bacterium]|nr:hypothetical protein [bacterium]
MSIIPSEQPPESGELIELVDCYLDQRLDEADGKRLEAMLRDDPGARRYCAERIRLHTELHSLARPLRIEIHEDRNLVIEQAGGISTVTAHHSNRVSVAPSLGRIEGSAKKRNAGGWLVALALAALIPAAWWVHLNRQDTARQQSPALSIGTLENASFEAETLKEGEIRNSVVGWETSTNKRQSAVVNPGKSLSGGRHLPESEAKLSSKQVLSLTIDRSGEAGWVRQRLYAETAMGAKRLQLADIDGRTLQVELTLIRPAVEGTAFAQNDVFLFAGIQEELRPGRKAAIYRIDTGAKGWTQADRHLALANDQRVKITFDLKVEIGEMRGDAFFVLGVARESPPGGEIYIDEVSLKLLER